MSVPTLERQNRASCVTVSAPPDNVFAGEPVVFEKIRIEQEGNMTHTVSQHWAVCIHRDPEETEGWLTGEVIGLPGVVSQGRDRQETLTNVKEALESALEELRSTNTRVELRREVDIPDGGEIIYLAL